MKLKITKHLLDGRVIEVTYRPDFWNDSDLDEIEKAGKEFEAKFQAILKGMKAS